MLETLEFKCVSCQASIQASPSQRDQSIVCVNCNTRQHVPSDLSLSPPVPEPLPADSFVRSFMTFVGVCLFASAPLYLLGSIWAATLMEPGYLVSRLAPPPSVFILLNGVLVTILIWTVAALLMMARKLIE